MGNLEDKKIYEEPEEEPELDEEAQRKIKTLLEGGGGKELHEDKGSELQLDLIVKEREKSIQGAQEMGEAHPKLLAKFQRVESNLKIVSLLRNARHMFENTRHYEDVIKIYEILISMGYSDAASVISAIRSKSTSMTPNIVQAIIEAGDRDFGIHLGIVRAAIESHKRTRKDRK